MPSITQVEWLNQNSLRNYPIRENAQRRPVYASGGYVEGVYLPNYLITDFVMTVDSELSADIFVKKIAIVSTALTIVFGCGEHEIGSVFVDMAAHTTNDSYRFTGKNGYENSVGCVVVGNVSNLFDDMPDGVYEFTFDETCFETRCVRPSIRRVASISIANQDTGYQSKKLVGDVKLIAGRNISLKYDAEKNAIWISADSNGGYNEQCNCGSSTTVKSINGISVENVTIKGDDCVSVTTSGNIIKISDKCSKPCCGCAELEFINEKIAQINTSINKLDTYTTVIDTRLTELQASYTQSAKGDATY